MPLYALALTLFAAPVAQQPPKAPVCPAEAEPIPAELAAWQNREPLTAATNPLGLAAARVTPGTTVDVKLAATPAVTFAVRPDHSGPSAAHGGMISFHVEAAATYRVALGSGAWVDVVLDRKSFGSAGHGHGPNCSGIRKTVDFKLQPGDYVLQISGNGEDHLPVLIVQLPG